jgi:hypothetical protein
VEPGNPLLDTGSEELQINQQATSLLDLLDTLFPASWTSFAFDVDDSVGVSLRAFQPSMPLIDDPELTMRSHKHLFTLVIKVGTFADVLEIFQSVFSRPKQLPTWSFFDHLVSAYDLRKSPINCGGRVIRQG